MKAVGHAVESILTALNTAGLKIAARTLRAWCAPAVGISGTAARTVSDALVEDAIRQLAFTTNAAGKRVLAPEGLYGRRKMLALVRRTRLPEAGSAPSIVPCARSAWPASCAGRDPERRSPTRPTSEQQTC